MGGGHAKARAGFIDVAKASAVRRSEFASGTVHELEIVTPDRNWRMRADTAEYLQEWITHLTEVMELKSAK